MNVNITLNYPALPVECYFSEGVAEEKIAPQQQEASRVLGSAQKQTGWGG